MRRRSNRHTRCNRTDRMPGEGGAVRYYIVQPWGRDKVREATRVSEHATATAAYAQVDWYTELSRRRGAGVGALELLVIDSHGRLVARPQA